jgi:ribonuclease HI
MEFTIYTDGGCSGNKRDAGCKGAWAFIILDTSKAILDKSSGLVENTTNNRMEMTAVYEGLVSLKKLLTDYYGGPEYHNCVVITDSKYVSNNFHAYIHEWKDNGWKKAGGGAVINVDLWKKIYSLSPEFKSFKFQWVKGHSTNKLNQAADALVRDLLYS